MKKSLKISFLTLVSMMSVNSIITNNVLADDNQSSSELINIDSVANDTSGIWGTCPFQYDASTQTLTLAGGVITNPNYGGLQLSESVKHIKITNTVKLPENSSYLFSFFPDLEDISGSNNIDTSAVTNMRGLFYDNKNLTQLDASHWDMSHVTSVLDMFYGTSNLKNLDASGWQLANLTSMQRMFYQSGIENLDTSHWDTSNVTNMLDVFYGTGNLRNLDISGWDTANVKTMQRMFYQSGIENLSTSHWDTSNVTNMVDMFYGTSNLRKLDVNGWNTSNITTMMRMFYQSGIKDLDASHWDTANVTNMIDMFNGTNNLTSLNISSWDMSNIVTYRIFKNSSVNKLILGFKNKFDNYDLLPDVPNDNIYTGKWVYQADPSGNSISNGPTYTSSELTSSYTPEKAGTYVWQKINDDAASSSSSTSDNSSSSVSSSSSSSTSNNSTSSNKPDVDSSVSNGSNSSSENETSTTSPSHVDNGTDTSGITSSANSSSLGSMTNSSNHAISTNSNLSATNSSNSHDDKTKKKISLPKTATKFVNNVQEHKFSYSVLVAALIFLTSGLVLTTSKHKH